MADQRSAHESAASSTSQSDFWDLSAVAFVVALVALAAVVGRYLNDRDVPIHATFPPLQGTWYPHVGPGSIAAIVIGACVLLGSVRMYRLAWWQLVTVVFGAATAWITALALVDGWELGFAGRLTSSTEYLADLSRVTSLDSFFTHFTASIPQDSADPWVVHVSSHPPGVMVLFELLDRLGLSGGAWAAALCVLVGASTSVALLMIARQLGGDAQARTLAPYACLVPGAVWIGVSADALFAGAVAWTIALSAYACTSSKQTAAGTAALGAGLLLGLSLYLSYGLILFVPVAVMVLIARGRWSTVLLSASGVLLVVLAVTLSGFWWVDGYQLTVERYYAGWGGTRPYSYWVWADLAAFAIAIGPAVVVGIRRMLASTPWSPPFSFLRDSRYSLALVVAATLVAVGLATLGGLSKAEVERIWLPFGALLTLACVAIPRERTSIWLGAQLVVVLLVQHFVATPW